MKHLENNQKISYNALALGTCIPGIVGTATTPVPLVIALAKLGLAVHPPERLPRRGGLELERADVRVAPVVTLITLLRREILRRRGRPPAGLLLGHSLLGMDSIANFLA